MLKSTNPERLSGFISRQAPLASQFSFPKLGWKPLSPATQSHLHHTLLHPSLSWVLIQKNALAMVLSPWASPPPSLFSPENCWPSGRDSAEEKNLSFSFHFMSGVHVGTKQNIDKVFGKTHSPFFPIFMSKVQKSQRKSQ